MSGQNRKGQSTLEYTIIWTAIVSAILAAANLYLAPAVEKMIEEVSNKIEAEVANFVDGLGK